MRAPEVVEVESRPVPTLSIQARMVVANLLAALAMTTFYVVAGSKARLGGLKRMPLTIAGYGAIAFAAFHLGRGWGWLAAGVLLIALESKLSDDGGKPE